MRLHSILRRLALPSIACALLAVPGSAHFIWLHVFPGEGGEGTRVEVLFGDGVWQDSDARLVRYVEGMRSWTEAGEELSYRVLDWGLETSLPGAVGLVGAQRGMGVFTPPTGGENRLLEYYAKGARDLEAASRVLGMHAEVVVVEAGADELVLQVLFDGAPREGAEVRFDATGTTTHTDLVTDAQGRVRVPRPPLGTFSARGRVILPEPGEKDGESYTTIQHYSTLVVTDVAGERLARGARPEAVGLVHGAVACLERLPDDLAVGGLLGLEVDGTTQRGEFELAGGELTLELPGADAELLRWTRAQILDQWTPKRALRFDVPSQVASVRPTPRDGHPLGRRFELADGTALRVHEREVRAVERDEGPLRSLRVVQENLQTPSGAYLPRHFTEHHRDRETGALVRAETYTDDYVEVDGLQLPKSRRVVVSDADSTSVRRIEFRNFELL